MWNKRSDEDYVPRPQIAPVPNPGQQAAARPAYAPPPAPPPAQKQTAAIGASMTIKGQISTREELLVDGEVDGEVESHSVLTVGTNGKVRANIKAREVDVSEKIAIREHGSLIGDIKAAGISIDDGAYFKGSIDIVRPEPKLIPKAVKDEPEVQAQAG